MGPHSLCPAALGLASGLWGYARGFTTGRPGTSIRESLGNFWGPDPLEEDENVRRKTLQNGMLEPVGCS